MEKPLLKMKAACEILDVSRPTMRQYLESEYVNGFKLPGGQWRIYKDSLLKRKKQEEAGRLNPMLERRAKRIGQMARDMAGGTA